MSIGDDKRGKSKTVSIGGEGKTETLYFRGRRRSFACVVIVFYLPVLGQN
jgi:hypothetical protein